MRSHKVIVTEPFRAEWEEVDLPEPGAGEIMVRTRQTMISTGTELTAYTGEFPPNSVWSSYFEYPWRTAGYSNVGTVMALGPDVTEYEVGQRVANRGHHATYNIQTLAQVYPIPDSMTDDQAVFLPLGCTVMNGVRLARIALGEAVVMVGAGILGQLALQYAAESGAFPLIAVDLSERRLQMAQEHRATHTLMGGRDDLLDDIREITRGRMADIAFEITGNQYVIPSILRMVRRLGRVILLGGPRGKVEVDFHNEVHTLGLQIIGAHVSTHPEVETPHTPWTKARNSEVFCDLVTAGRLQLDDLVTHRYPWREAPAAYQMLAADRSQAMAVVLEGWEG